MDKEFLKELKETRKDYESMIKFCCNDWILNNSIYTELTKADFYFDFYCGEFGENEEIYQYYIINEQDAERLAEYTNELVIFNEDLDLYLLCVTHLGTAWSGVAANWKD